MKTMSESDRTIAEHIAHVVRDFQIQQTGQAPKSVNVVLSGDTAVVTVHRLHTFGVWENGSLVRSPRRNSGLTDQEIQEVDRFVRQNILERFGPVRSGKPALVFELAFESIQRSTRHKSGIAVRFPRISRRRTDKTPDQADSHETLRKLMDQPEPEISGRLFLSPDRSCRGGHHDVTSA
jgi:hypothetical protein